MHTTADPGMRWARQVARTAGFGLLYVAAVLVGRATRVEATHLALVWPAAGVAVLWLLSSPTRRWRLVDLASLLLIATLGNLATGSPPALSALLAASNVVNAVVCVLVLQRTGATGLTRPRDWFGLASASIAGALSSACIGPVAALLLTGQGDLARTMPAWALRHTVSVVVVLAVGLTIPRLRVDPQRRGRQAVHGALLVAVGAAVMVPVFHTARLPLAFLVLPVGAWAALLLPTAAAIAYSAGLGTVAVWATLLGFGPFSVVDEVARAAIAQAFLVALVGSTAVLASVRDQRDRLVHQLWTARQAASDQGRLLDSVIDSISDGVVLLDASGAPVIWNAAARRFLPRIVVDPGRWIPVFDVATVQGRPIPMAERPLSRALAGEVVPREDFLVFTPEGRRILAASARPVHGAARAHALGVFHDVTADRDREAELSAFAGAVAHDLGNPLAAADGWLEVVEECLATGGADDLAEATLAATRARAATSRMRDLIRDLLAYSTARGAVLDIGPVDVAALVDDVLADHLDRSGCLPLVGIGELPVVRGDLVLLRQLVANVIGNAVKYTADGQTPRLDLTGGVTADGATGWLEVRDHGIGIPAGEHEAVFDEFHRAHTGGRPGTGLGLAICRRIAGRHGGTITARAAAGAGTVVRVELPAAVGGLPAGEAPVLVSAASGGGPS